MKSYFSHWQLVLLVIGLFLQACEKDPLLDPNSLRACFTIDKDPIYANVGAFYTAECSQNADSYRWYMGEGTIIDESAHNFVYTHSGTYTISLVVKRGSQKDSISRRVEVIKPNIIMHDNEAIWEDITWEEGVHEIKGTLNVVEGTLTILPGTVIRLQSDASFNVGNQSAASIIAHGTADRPIRFTSAQANPAAGDWNDLHIGGHAVNPSFKHCIFEYGGRGNIYKGVITATFGASFSLENCTIKHAATNGILLRDESYFRLMQNNTIEHIGGYAMLISPFKAATIGNGNTITSRGILLDNVPINKNVRLTRQSCPYIVQGDMHVGSTEGTIFTVDPGVHMAFMDRTVLEIGGQFTGKATFLANGTAEAPIVITSFNPTGASTDLWGGISFMKNTAAESSLHHCTIEKVGSYRKTAVVDIWESSISMEYCRISGNVTFGLDLNFDGVLSKFAFNDIGVVNTHSIRLPLSMLPVIETNNTFSGGKQIWLKSAVIDQAETYWPNYGVPYYLKGGYIVSSGEPAGARLSIQAGVHVRMDANSYFNIGYSGGKGTLVAVGTAAAPISFTLARETVTSNNPVWRGLDMDSNLGVDTRLEHVLIEGCRNGVDITGAWGATEGVPAIVRCTFQNIAEYGIYNNSGTPYLFENIFINMGWGNTYGI